jgi:hypothetical protein
MRAKTVNETQNFERGLDPKKAMNIGLISEIEKFCKEIYPNDKTLGDYLVTCAGHGKINFVKYLLDKGAYMHADNDEALQWACENGYAEIVKMLLDAGADVHTRGDYVLREASYIGHTETVKVLLDAGADVHARNDEALRLASENGHTETVKVLLAAGADVHVYDDYALREARKNGHTETVKVLKDWIAKEKGLKESLKFERGLDPKQAMDVGLYWKKDLDDVVEGLKKLGVKAEYEQSKNYPIGFFNFTLDNLFDPYDEENISRYQIGYITKKELATKELGDGYQAGFVVAGEDGEYMLETKYPNKVIEFFAKLFFSKIK